MRHRLAILSLVLVLLAPASAIAQDGNPFDGQLPPPQPAQTATPAPVDSSSDDDVGRTTLYLIGGVLLVFFVVIGWWISRDARSNLPEDERDHLRGMHTRDEGPHKHERQAKAKARAKGRAQRQARKAHRKKGGKARR
jgi:hypothetical protein